MLAPAQRSRFLSVSAAFLAACSLFAAVSLGGAPLASGSQATAPGAPEVKKVEPPNWWIGLTPEVMLLLSGSNLQATRVACNLPSIVVSRTQASPGGRYLFVWLELEAGLRSGIAVCRVTTGTGETSFELPLSNREPALRRAQGLSSSDVLYLIIPDRFANGDPANDEPASAPGSHDRSDPRAYHGGDLRGIEDHLPYLKDLGVTALWLTPIVKNGARRDYHGYGAVDLYAVDPHLGTLADYKNLVSVAHAQRLKILFDAVPNHVGPLHPWVGDPPLPDWFHGSAAKHLDSYSPIEWSFYGKPENPGYDMFEALEDPHAPDSMRRNIQQGWFFGILPDLNTENPVARQYLLQNSIWWIESSGLDGFRVDTFPYVSRSFWQQWTSGLRKIYPRLFTIGEIFHPDPDVTSFFAGGHRGYDGIDTGVSTVFDYPMYFALRDVLLRGAPAGKIADVLRHDFLYPRPAELVTFFGNHDVPRFAGAEGSSVAKIELAFALTLTLRGIPQLYYGDEIGMTGGGDPGNRRDFPGGWKEDPKNAFTQAGRSPLQQEIFACSRELLHLRAAHEALQSGRLWHLASGNDFYVFLRETDSERIVVAFNNSEKPQESSFPVLDTPAQRLTALTPLFGAGKAQISGSSVRLFLPPQSVTIFQLD